MRVLWGWFSAVAAQRGPQNHGVHGQQNREATHASHEGHMRTQPLSSQRPEGPTLAIPLPSPPARPRQSLSTPGRCTVRKQSHTSPPLHRVQCNTHPNAVYTPPTRQFPSTDSTRRGWKLKATRVLMMERTGGDGCQTHLVACCAR
jgi:hypothetical protein